MHSNYNGDTLFAPNWWAGGVNLGTKTWHTSSSLLSDYIHPTIRLPASTALGGEIIPGHAKRVRKPPPWVAIKRPCKSQDTTVTVNTTQEIPSSTTFNGQSIWTVKEGSALRSTGNGIQGVSTVWHPGEETMIEVVEFTIGLQSWSAIQPGLKSAEDSIHLLQGVTSVKEAEKAVARIANWASTCSRFELEEFRTECKYFPSIMWVSPFLPQMDFQQVQVTLQEIHRKDKGKRTGQTIACKNLLGAYLMGIIWARLYLRGVITKDMFYDGCDLIWDSEDYARRSIIGIIIATVLNEPFSGRIDLSDKLLLAEKGRLVSNVQNTLIMERINWELDHI